MILIIPIFLGLLPAAIAAAKGKNFFLWWLYGAALFIFALPHSIFASTNKIAIDYDSSDSEANIKCPSCAETIKSDAKICRYCQRDIYPALTAAAL